MRLNLQQTGLLLFGFFQKIQHLKTLKTVLQILVLGQQILALLLNLISVKVILKIYTWYSILICVELGLVKSLLMEVQQKIKHVKIT